MESRRERLRVAMNSQRLREQRIEERLQGGALALATPSDRVQATPTSDKVCHGCLEPNADARVGDQPWHLLCGLYWQGRSEVVRSERIPYTPAGPGITPARSRWVIVVPVGRADRYAALRRRFGRSPWVDVVMDRRRGERPPHELGGASFSGDGCGHFRATRRAAATGLNASVPSPRAGSAPWRGKVSLPLARFDLQRLHHRFELGIDFGRRAWSVRDDDGLAISVKIQDPHVVGLAGRLIPAIL